MKYEFPAMLNSRKRSGIEIHFPDLPALRVTATSEKGVHIMAQSALSEALAQCMLRRLPLPTPSACPKAQLRVPIPLLLASKLALARAMLAQRLSNTALAKRLGVTEAVVRRLTDPRHSSKIEKVEEALQSLGVSVSLADSA